MTTARTCCPTHNDRCKFGRDHQWAGPFIEDGTWSHPDDVKCIDCGGVCTAGREDAQPEPEDLTEKQLAAIEARLTYVPHFRVGPATCNCGYSAYKINGIMIDYAYHFQMHLANHRDPSPRPVNHDDVKALIAEVRKLSKRLQGGGVDAFRQ